MQKSSSEVLRLAAPGELCTALCLSLCAAVLRSIVLCLQAETLLQSYTSARKVISILLL